MSKKKAVLGLMTALLVTSLIYPTISQAFWPFDMFMNKGEVKGETTEDTGVKKPSNIRSIFRRPTKTPTPTSAVVSIGLDEEISENKINELSRGKVISEAQRKEMLAKLAVIKAKRAELKRLHEAFIAWMKANKIDPKILIGTDKPSVTPQKGRPTPKTSVTPGPELETTDTQSL